jgi:hypothetical protein
MGSVGGARGNRMDAVVRRTVVAVRMVLAFVLFGAALSKLTAMIGDAQAVFIGLRGLMASVAVAGIAGLEVIAALLLCSSAWRFGSVLAFFLGCAFGIWSAGMMYFGYPLQSCGCFGHSEVSVATHVLIVGGLLLGGRFLVIAGETSS